MIKNQNRANRRLPLYEVKELSMEEALLVLAAEKESLLQSVRRMSSQPPPARQIATPLPLVSNL